MKNIIKDFLILAALFIFSAEPVLAQATTAMNVQPGYLTTANCPGGNTACFKSSTAPVNSATGEANHVFKNAPGVLYGFSVTTGATAGYALVYNATSAPVDGAVTPVACYAVPANTTIGVAYTPLPVTFTTGITIVFSSTGCFTQTSSATAFFIGEVL